jgi:hypothetical protein
VDGVLDGSGVRTNNMAISAEPIDIGINYDRTRFFNGKIDDVRIYTRALSAAEIKGLAKGSSVVGSFTSPSAGANGGLVGWWTFDGKNLTTATATDSSGNTFNGTLMVSPTAAIGKLGQALSFNGTNYIALPNSAALDLTSAYTISAWINPRSFSNYQNVIYKNGTVSSGQYGIIVFADGHWEAECIIGGVGAGVTGGTLSLNKWQHVTVTLTGTTLKTYLNGALITTNNSASSGSAGTAATIGADIVNNRPFNGKIDDVRIYNRALSATEVYNLYKLGGK